MILILLRAKVRCRRYIQCVRSAVMMSSAAPVSPSHCAQIGPPVDDRAPSASPDYSKEDEELCWDAIEAEIGHIAPALLSAMRPRELLTYLAGSLGVKRRQLIPYKEQVARYAVTAIIVEAYEKKRSRRSNQIALAGTVRRSKRFAE